MLCHNPLYKLKLAWFDLLKQDSENQSKAVGPEPQYLDEFTGLLVPDDTRVMVDLLKLAVSLRSGDKGKEVLSAVLSGMGTAFTQVNKKQLFSYSLHVFLTK